MTKYIENSKVLDTYADIYWKDERLLNFRKELDEVFEALRSLPAADVAEVKHGKWELYDNYKQTIDGRTFDGWCECSECKTMYRREISEYIYCPSCGAKMDLANE